MEEIDIVIITLSVLIIVAFSFCVYRIFEIIKDIPNKGRTGSIDHLNKHNPPVSLSELNTENTRDLIDYGVVSNYADTRRSKVLVASPSSSLKNNV